MFLYMCHKLLFIQGSSHPTCANHIGASTEMFVREDRLNIIFFCASLDPISLDVKTFKK